MNGPLSILATGTVNPPSERSEPEPAVDRRNQLNAGRWPVLFCLIGVAGFALLLRTQHLTDISLHFDECCSWKISQFPWNEMLDAVSRDAHPPVYYVLLKGLGTLGLDSPAAIRGFSVLWGLATVGAAYCFVLTALSTTPDDRNALSSSDHTFAAVLAAALVAASALQVEMSLQARPYSLGTFLTLLSGVFLLRAVRPTGRAFDWAGFAASATMLSLTHYYGMFSAVALFLFGAGALTRAAWCTGWSPDTKRLLAGLGLSVWGVQFAWAFWLPTFLFQQARSTRQLWMAPLKWEDLSTTCWMVLAGGQTSSVPKDWAWLAVAVWITTILALMMFGRQGDRLAAVCAGFPVAAVVAYGLAVRNILGVKYLIFAHVFFLVGWALVAARLPWKPARALLAIGLLAWSGYWCWQHSEIRESQANVPGVRGAVVYLDQRRGPGEPVVVGSPFVHPIVQKYANDKTSIYVRNLGNHRDNILGGPPLRDEEYRDLDRVLERSGDRVWAIDVYDMFGPQTRFEAGLSGDWQLIGQEEFREAYGMACVLAVREYHRTGQRK